MENIVTAIGTIEEIAAALEQMGYVVHAEPDAVHVKVDDTHTLSAWACLLSHRSPHPV